MADDMQATSPLEASRPGKTPYYTVAELMAMNEPELQALWDQVPPERQTFYESAYEAALASLGPGDVSDDAAMGIIEQILTHYDAGQVPILSGNRWVQVPSWVRIKIEKGEDPTSVTQEVEQKVKARPARAGGRPSIQLIVAIVGFAIVLFCIIYSLILRLMQRGEPTEAEMTSTAAVAEAQMTASAVPPTLTPLGLQNTDQIIRDGEDFTGYYPVLLEVRPQAASTPRVYVVQQKPIQIADWDYDTRSPDIASWISGLLVKPVLGIPYSESAVQLLTNLRPGDTLVLHMSTGTTLRFIVNHTARINPQDTTVFRQTSPGIVVVLLGEPNAPDRLAVFGDYPPEQELLEEGGGLNPAGAAAVLHTGEAATPEGADAAITVLRTYASLGASDSELPLDIAYLFVDLDIQAGAKPVDTRKLQFDLIDSAGTRYSPITFNPALAHHMQISSVAMDPGTRVQGTIGFYVPRSLTNSAMLLVRTSQTALPVAYLLEYSAPADLSPLAPEVALLSVRTERQAGSNPELVVVANAFNPNDQQLVLRQQDFYVIFAPGDPGDTVFPIGPQILPATMNGGPFVDIGIPSAQAVELEARFPWDNSPYVGIYILGYHFVAQLR